MLEEDYEEEDKFESKKKHSKNTHHASSKEDTKKQQQQQTAQRSKHLTKEKTSHIDENASEAKTDIRTAFFKASASAKAKPDKQQAANADEDDLANEIMLELQKKKTTAPTKPANRAKPVAPPTTMTTTQKPIPFSVNSNISQSPAHKRKLSPSANLVTDNKIQSNETSSRCHKKIELDDDLVQQLFETDSQPTCEAQIVEIKSNAKSAHLNDVSNSNFHVKTEPIEHGAETPTAGSAKAFTMSNVVIKKEKDELLNDEDQEALENIELLSQLTLEASNSSMLAKQLNLPMKQEGASGDCLNTTASDLDMDFQLHIKNQSNTNKLVFYWLDAFEDQFNSHGTVYLFGKMPILKQQAKKEADKDKDSSKETQTNNSSEAALSFVSVCCVVKNIPKVVYVLPRKCKKTSAKVESEESSGEIVTMDQVSKEIDALMEKNKIHSYKTKVVKKNFAFDRRGMLFFILY